MERVEENNYSHPVLDSHFELIEQTDEPRKPAKSFEQGVVDFAKRHKINKTTLTKVVKEANATTPQEEMAALAAYVDRRK